jgi:hypothetical protein
MQVNPYLQAQIQQQARITQKPGEKRQVERLRPEESNDEKKSSQQGKQQVRIDQGAIEKLDQQSFKQQAFYDQPQGKGQQAINAYNDINHQAQREDVQQMLGVDLFA